MKVLVVSRNLPSDFRTKVHGVYQRLRMFLEGINEIASIHLLFYVASDLHISPSVVAQTRQSFLEQWNIELNLILFPSEKFQEEECVSKKIGQYLGSSMSVFKQPGYMETSGVKQLAVFEDCLRFQPDAIFVDKLQAMCPILLTKKSLPPVFFNMDDIEHVGLLRSSRKMLNWRTKILSYSRVPALMLSERRALGLATKTFICSELDRKYLARLGLRKVGTVPNAVAIPNEQPYLKETSILFIGSYSYRPNIEAAEFLIEKIWPKIYTKIPTAKLIIAGAHPEKIRGYGVVKQGIEFSGFVENLEDLYRQTQLVCAPILSGAGTRVKIIEAAAYGKPIVATSLGAEGLDLRDGKELIIRDDAESFVAACLELLTDVSRCERIGNAARVRTIQLYDKRNIIKLIRSYLINIHHSEND